MRKKKKSDASFWTKVPQLWNISYRKHFLNTLWCNKFFAHSGTYFNEKQKVSGYCTWKPFPFNLFFSFSFSCWDCAWWTSRMPEPVKYRLKHRRCRCTHLLQMVLVQPQRIGDIRQSQRSLHRQYLPEVPAKSLLFGKHKEEKRWQWQEDNTLSCELPFVHKTRWSWQNRQAAHRICFHLTARSLFPQSGN